MVSNLDKSRNLDPPLLLAGRKCSAGKINVPARDLLGVSVRQAK